MKRGDRITALVAIVIIAASLAVMWTWRRPAHKGVVARIIQDGQILRTFDLATIRKRTLLRFSCSGGHYNSILLEHGRIRFSDSDCPNRTCVDAGWISSPGDMAVCLPHRLMIVIERKGEEDGPDAVSY